MIIIAFLTLYVVETAALKIWLLKYDWVELLLLQSTHPSKTLFLSPNISVDWGLSAKESNTEKME